MDNLRGFLSIRRIDRVPNARIRELCKVRKVQPCGEAGEGLDRQESLCRRMCR